MNEKINMEATKKAVILAGSAAVTMVVMKAIKTVCPVGGTLIEKIGIPVGSTILSGLAADRASDYLEKKVDKLAEEVEKKLAAETPPAEEVAVEA